MKAVKPQTHVERTATEVPHWNSRQKNLVGVGGGVGGSSDNI